MGRSRREVVNEASDFKLGLASALVLFQAALYGVKNCLNCTVHNMTHRAELHFRGRRRPNFQMHHLDSVPLCENSYLLWILVGFFCSFVSYWRDQVLCPPVLTLLLA